MKLKNLLRAGILFLMVTCGKNGKEANEQMSINRKKVFIYKIIPESIKVKDGDPKREVKNNNELDNIYMIALCIIDVNKTATFICSVKDFEGKNPYENDNVGLGSTIQTKNGDIIEVSFGGSGIRGRYLSFVPANSDWMKSTDTPKVQIKNKKIQIEIPASSMKNDRIGLELKITPKDGRSGSYTFELRTPGR